MKQNFFSAKRITLLGVLLALVVVLQVFAASIPVGPVNFTLTLVPIVLGAILLGPIEAGFLGLIFGFVVMLTDPFAATLFGIHPVLTTLTVLVKSTAAGVAAGFTYRLLYGKNKYAATVVAAIVAPIVNTGLFILGMLTMMDVLLQQAGDNSVMYLLFIVYCGWNFLIEFGLNLVLCPSIYRVCEVVTKRKF